MSKVTTIKVPIEVRDRIAERARNSRETMAEAVAHALDATDEVDFWARAQATMGTAAARADLQRESERFSATLMDELEPEDWSDILCPAATSISVTSVTQAGMNRGIDARW